MLARVGLPTDFFGEEAHRMADVPSAGYLEYRGRTYRLDSAECAWYDGLLYVRASGGRCRFVLVGARFPGAASLAELPGRRWEPEGLSPADDVFAEGGGVELRGRPFAVLAIRLACPRYAADAGTLGLELWCQVEEEETGESGEVEGALRCRVVALGEDGW
jgi:hypothetical protein